MSENSEKAQPSKVKNTIDDASKSDVAKDAATKPKREIGGPSGLEPTRFGDWEKNGRCSDF